MSVLPAGLVLVGRVGKPHGVRGEVRLAPETDFPERLGALGEALLVREGAVRAVRLETVRRAGTGLLVKIAGIDAPEAARSLRGAWLAVPRERAAPLPAGRHYVFDVLGMAVRTEDGLTLGVVDEVIRTPANDVYAVRGPRGAVLVPAVASVVLEVDVAARCMVIRLLPGMLEAEP